MRATVLVALIAVAGCNNTPSSGGDDLSRPRDGGAPDQATAGSDQAMGSGDMATANDLAAGDLAVAADLAGADLAGADLATVDLARSVDLAGLDLAARDAA